MIWASNGIPDFSEERLLPDGCQVLIFNFANQPVVQALNSSQPIGKSGHYFLAGPSSIGHRLLYETDAFHSQVGIIFQPGVQMANLGIIPAEIRNQAIVEDLLPDFWEGLYDQLFKSRTWETRFAILLQRIPDLCSQFSLPDVRAKQLAMAVAGGLKSVSEIARSLGYSPQYLNRILESSYGMPIKTLQSVRRMESVLDRMKKPDLRISLTEMALELGYFDQAHFVHDCRKLTGFSPKDLLRWSSDRTSRVMYL